MASTSPVYRRLARLLVAAAMAAPVAISGCATDSPNRNRNIGIALGAIGGAVLGNNVGDGDTKTRVLGAAGGALIGGAVGNYMDKQRAELERQLADEQQREQLGITEVGDNTLKIGVAGDATFPFDEATIEPQFKPTFDKIASVLADYDKTIVHVVGHTDSVGAEAYNKGLSMDRATAVSTYMSREGVNGSRILSYGAGESNPVATNDTEAGRRQNRRVEIFIKPVVEGQERQAYQPPPGVRG